MPSLSVDLQYFVFSVAEDGLGHACWEGLASVQAEHREAAEAEATALLAVLAAQAPGPRGPLDEGGAWDWQLDRVADDGWIGLHLTVLGPVGWADALLDSAE